MKRAFAIALLATLALALPVAAHPQATWSGFKVTDERCPGSRSVRLYVNINYALDYYYLVLCGDAHNLFHDPHNANSTIYNFAVKISSVKITNKPYAPPGYKWVVALYRYQEFQSLCVATPSQIADLRGVSCNDHTNSVRWELWPA